MLPDAYLLPNTRSQLHHHNLCSLHSTLERFPSFPYLHANGGYYSPTAVGSSLTDWHFYAHRQCSTQLYVCADCGPLRELRIKEEDGVCVGESLEK